MGYATAILGCGCSHTMTMGESGKLIDYKRCAEHYVPEDDVKILEAEKNKREHDKQLWDEATTFFHGVKL